MANANIVDSINNVIGELNSTNIHMHIRMIVEWLGSDSALDC